MSQQVDSTIRQEQMLGQLSGAFAVLGVLITCLGLYGVLSYSVVRRRREFGIRLAVGAQPRRILSMILREAALLLAAGIPLGIAGAWVGNRAIQSFLFGVRGNDLPTYGAVIVLLAGVALLAAAVPATRAARVDPAKTLRAE